VSVRGTLLYSVDLHAASALEARRARLATLAFARTMRTTDIDLDALGLILGELVTNAVQHGKVPISVHLYNTKAGVLLAVYDGGAGLTLLQDRAPPDHSHRGRGLYVVQRLARTVQLASGARRGIEVLLPTRAG
jgi:anti-sigma regulatory factor (Ser/Thr protein kinase)